MSHGPQSADDQVARILAGDRAECEELVRQTYPGVYRFLLHLTSDPETAADLTQDTFRTAWQKLGGFDGRSSIASWLHRIAYNRFVDAYRKQRRDSSVREVHLELSRQAIDTTACAAAFNETSEYLRAAVNQLPEDQKTIMFLHYFQGLSLQETAMVVGQAVGTVKWRLSVALTHLRSIVDTESVQ
jgi:RNA polymerase sigma-70 factor (ECF subfamily)